MSPRSYKIPSVIAVALIMPVTAEFYRVRELLAAKVIFTALFGILGTALLIAFFVQESALKGMTHFELGMARIRARHSAASAHPHGDSVIPSDSTCGFVGRSSSRPHKQT